MTTTAAERFAEAKDKFESLVAQAIASPVAVEPWRLMRAHSAYAQAWISHIGRWRQEFKVEEDAHAGAD